ncbi:MAG: CoA transferase [Burkholderiales bacterium]|nr:CoA transferase [Burkholderiales bacterium]
MQERVIASPETKRLPLAGIRVIEFCHTIMGPSCGLALADLGADVIKVEPVEGDRTRRLGGFAAGFFSYFNRNKRSIALDLKSAEGRDIVARMVAHADVLVENFAPVTLQAMGYGYEALSQLNPRLVYCSLKGFLAGPYEKRPALDEIVQYMAGLAYMTGPPGRPLRAGASVVDILGGTFGALAILAALEERHRTGRGQLVKSALFESTAYLVAQHMVAEKVAHAPVPPMPARRSAWCVYETFPTRDGQLLFVGLTTNNIWKRFCQAFGLDALLADPSLQTNEQRVEARARILPLVAEIVARHDMADLMARLEALDVPFSPVVKPGELFDDPHLNSGNRMLSTQLLDGQRVKLPAIPVEMDDHALGLRHDPPLIGEHTRAVLREIGMDEQAIVALIASGKVASHTRAAP